MTKLGSFDIFYRATVSAFFSDLQSGNEYMPRRKPITLVSEVVSSAKDGKFVEKDGFCWAIFYF